MLFFIAFFSVDELPGSPISVSGELFPGNIYILEIRVLEFSTLISKSFSLTMCQVLIKLYSTRGRTKSYLPETSFPVEETDK